jgi:hypothetical protein
VGEVVEPDGETVQSTRQRSGPQLIREGGGRSGDRSSGPHRGQRGGLGAASKGELVKLATIVAFGVGYLVGTKAGRERYEQIVAAAKRRSGRLGELGEKLEQYSKRPSR